MPVEGNLNNAKNFNKELQFSHRLKMINGAKTFANHHVKKRNIGNWKRTGKNNLKIEKQINTGKIYCT